MTKVNNLGTLIHFDEKTKILSFQLDFVDLEMLEQIEYLLEHKRPIKHSFSKVKPFRSKTYPQQKKFWVDFYKILRALNVPATLDNCAEQYKYIKENIFPARKYTSIKDEYNKPVDNYYIPEMKDLSVEEMAKVIEDLHTFYAYLNIQWEII